MQLEIGQAQQRTNIAWIIIVASGVVAGLHIWKLSPALGIIRDELGFSLFFSGVLLGVVQVAGMVGGLAVSLISEVISQRRTFLVGLLLLVIGSALGALSSNAFALLATRIIEGAGVIMATVMGPGLVRLHAPLKTMNMAVGWWAAYMGLATFIGVFSTALALQHLPWHLWWAILSCVSLIPIPLILKFVPADSPPGSSAVRMATSRIAATARSPQVWVSGLIFGCYTVQWMAVVGFLPTIYAEFGLSAVAGGLASAVVGGLNAVGAIICGALLHRGLNGRTLLFTGFGLMALTSVLTFAVNYPAGLLWVQMLGVGMFSLGGAAIPTTLTRIVVDLAPPGGSAPAAMGLAQQIFNIGNFTGPMLLAAMVSWTGGWNSTWRLTLLFAALGSLLTLRLSRKNSPFATSP
ncbi:MFS transporter [Glutamicibacter halophytocola]|uniref:MFS transporter n=1 Tax=Glutamicibacter halophytocola TaxID=1933880 RepID=A0AA94XXI0_9MICC|nr:MFS transporter [Glutamicibacter halophytocola]UUX58777.1 MFS transporter [Glutamicibacter halophytocola]